MKEHSCKYEDRVIEMEKKISAMYVCICGNGTKGLSQRVDTLESDNKLFSKIVYSLGGVGAFLWGLFQVLK